MTDEIIAIKYLNKIKNTKEKGLNFDLTLGQFKRLMNTKTCHFTGIELCTRKPIPDREPKFNAITLDRLDNSKGYTKENTVVCCYGWNQIKSELENPCNKFKIKNLIKGTKTTEKYKELIERN